MRGRTSILAVVLALVAPAAVEAAVVLKAKMTGGQLVNEDGGARGGAAEAILDVDEPRRRLCFEIAYSGLGSQATAGYLREGDRGETARPSVVLFAGRAASPVTGCVGDLPARTLGALSDHPSGHYVDVATRALPKGAVRGQLRESDGFHGGLAVSSSGGVGR
jgi:hypothetical protein